MYFFGRKKRRGSKRSKRRGSKRRRSNKRVEFYTKDGQLVSFVPKGRKRRGSKRRRSGRMSNKKARHIRRATKAMKLYQSGKARTLKQAWKMV